MQKHFNVLQAHQLNQAAKLLSVFRHLMQMAVQDAQYTPHTHTHTHINIGCAPHMGLQPDLCDSCREAPEDLLLHLALWRKRTLVLGCISLSLAVCLSLQLYPLSKWSFIIPAALEVAPRRPFATHQNRLESSSVRVTSLMEYKRVSNYTLKPCKWSCF